MYTGAADWTMIARVKENQRLHIPVIGNGDIVSPELARDAFTKYGVDGVMVGRASIGAPWIFHDIKECMHSTDGTYTPLSLAERFALLRRQIHESVERIDEYRGILHVRRHLAASPLFKGIPSFRETRIAMLRANTLAELEQILDRVQDMLSNNQ
jgi:tRNA-dihydrouridine synthase